MSKTVLYRKYPIGELAIVEDGGGISDLFLRKSREAVDAREGMTPVLERAAAELDEYFAGKRKTFTVPLALHGTSFQKSVWQALREIPYGQTRSYGEIARAVGSPKGFRAVGLACNRNPVLLMVPCHRVVGRDGGLTGFACGLAAKRFLLELEHTGISKEE